MKLNPKRLLPGGGQRRAQVGLGVLVLFMAISCSATSTTLYQATNWQAGGVIAWIAIGIFATLNGVFWRSITSFPSSLFRVFSKRIRSSFVIYAFSVLFFGWWWIVPSEHNSPLILTTLVAFGQTIPLYIVGIQILASKTSHHCSSSDP